MTSEMSKTFNLCTQYNNSNVVAMSHKAGQHNEKQFAWQD